MGENREHEGQRVLVGNVLFGADDQVARWVGARIPGFQLLPDTTALGVVRGGSFSGIDDLRAGVVYENANGVNVFVSIAANPGDVWWATPATMRALFRYPFIDMDLRSITTIVPSSNWQSLNLATGLGFQPEALIKYAAYDGSAMVVMKMYRETCRWIRNGQVFEQRAESA